MMKVVPGEKIKKFAPIVGACLLFLLVSAYTLSTNIHGDATFHTLFAREILESGSLLEHFPYSIMDVKEGEPVFAPISYPQTFHIFLAPLLELEPSLELDKIWLLKFLAPFLGFSSALFIFLLLRSVLDEYVALGCGVFAVILNFQRFIMTPLIEQLLFLAMFGSIYFYYMSITKKQTKYSVLTGIFLGLAISLKQQGLILFIAILLHLLLKMVLNKDERRRLIRNSVILFTIAIVLSVPPILDQLSRNGTILPVPAYPEEALPFMEPRYIVDDDAYRELRNIIGYFVNYEHFGEAFGSVFLYPFFYHRSLGFFRSLSKSLIQLSVGGALFLLGSLYLIKRNKTLSGILLSAFSVDLLVMYSMSTKPYQYHNLLLGIFAILFISGVYYFGHLMKKFKYGKHVTALFSALIVILLSTSFMTYIHEPSWGDSGRQSDHYLTAYRQIGEDIKAKTSDKDLFIAAETNFLYYAERNSIWLSEGGGKYIPLIFSSKNVTKTVERLSEYNAKYIVINFDQTKRRGVYDYIPEEGLLTYIDKDPHFELLPNLSYFDLVKVYKIIYNP